METRGGYVPPWSWSYTWPGFWELNPGPLKEQVPLTAEPSLQTQQGVCVCVCVTKGYYTSLRDDSFALQISIENVEP